MKTNKIIETQIEKLHKQLNKNELAFGEILFNNGGCQVLSQSPVKYELIVSDEITGLTTEYELIIDVEENITPAIEKEVCEWNKNSFACLLQVESELHLLDPKENIEHKKYTRKGMIQRVLKERQQKADKAQYRIKWADNIYGNHILTNEKGVKYKIFLRNFETETGYSNSMDSKLNKLGTTKHIMYVFNKLKENKLLYKRLKKTYPFIEIFCDPLNDYKITWHFPHKLPLEGQLLISRYFKKSHFIEEEKITSLLGFIEEAANNNIIHIRPEVQEKLEAAFENEMLGKLSETYQLNFDLIKASLFDYQKEGIAFSLFRKVSIIADEMGLGKTIQAIGAAILKKEVFGFKKTLVVCPASIKEQWKKEIEKFSDELAMVVQGFPDERTKMYQDKDHYFFIVNYETVLRDQMAINKASIDFLILDEAQRAKNYETKTASSLKRIEAKHKLVITGTPIENKLIDIFSIMGILDPHFFGPLWEFSYQHCLFDPERYDKINGYFNLKSLNKKLDKILLRREKRKVIDQLPNLQQINIPLELSPLQAEYHASYAKGLAQIIRKKFLTPYDLQRMQLLLANMRMVCDSTYLIDDETNESPKLEELKHILIEKLDVKNTARKIIIFSEWIKVHKLIGKLLRDNNIGFVELNGKIPVKSRGELIRKFEENQHYKIFLSTEAGGSGLNLQVADILFNFELPWNPAKKNQRIGRIDRLGQTSKKLTIFNFITRNSIEQQIASGLLVKQSLFDGVLGDNSNKDFVDFSTKGRSQFILQLEEFVSKTEGQTFNEETLFTSDELDKEIPKIEKQPEEELDFSIDEMEHGHDNQNNVNENEQGHTTREGEPLKVKEFEEVMNNGMQFLSGMFKLSTGKEMGIENQSITVNKETGEVTMKFKLPV
ncbi:MAG: DEAD/DEAH box helicase [Prolixibacteraceae bacterium]|jgi:SNF2 family DNA or RNA helicase|nr:DEAD/DEAH box helicase [Prolixibacteraceae bacterium]MBT7000120.1 DEAD/DEAH box helicase [Prolixibacteraceae bacterium]MBT7395028.1 DEAD/DEAH box helicase [Prolixibacteraceae bacterium]